jgi:hypothetical protein
LTARSFPTIPVTLEAEALIQDLEAALMRLYSAPKGTASENAYAALNQRRKELYSHISSLEACAGWERTVLKRFD